MLTKATCLLIERKETERSVGGPFPQNKTPQQKNKKKSGGKYKNMLREISGQFSDLVFMNHINLVLFSFLFNIYYRGMDFLLPLRHVSKDCCSESEVVYRGATDDDGWQFLGRANYIVVYKSIRRWECIYKGTPVKVGNGGKVIRSSSLP